jgi:ribosomal-protein-alanine N-acetyltransferase
MDEKYANEIAYNWKYDGSYSFYDITADKEDLKEFLNPEKWEYTFAVLNELEELIGFYSFYFKSGIMWIGFGLKPDFTGKGHGFDFVLSGIKYGIKKYNYDKDYLMLGVAKFNKRAIKVYKKIGFQIVEEYLQETNGGKYSFVKMKKDIK